MRLWKILSTNWPRADVLVHKFGPYKFTLNTATESLGFKTVALNVTFATVIYGKGVRSLYILENKLTKRNVCRLQELLGN
jgi:hypothetical protein